MGTKTWEFYNAISSPMAEGIYYIHLLLIFWGSYGVRGLGLIGFVGLFSCMKL